MKNGLSGNKKDETAAFSLIFPGPERWEFWHGSSPESLSPAGTAERPQELPMPEGVIFCFPGSAFSSLPLWNAVAEGVTSQAQAALNLEGRGLLGADPESAVWALDVVRRQGKEDGKEERELTASAVLQPHLSPDWILDGIRRHEIPGRLLLAPPSGSGAVLRKELGRWILDLYEAGRWLHSQTLLAQELGEEAGREIRLLLAQMEQEGISWEWRDLVLKAPVSSEVAATLARLTGLRTVQGEGSQKFKLPASQWDLLPREVAERRQTQSRQKRLRTLLTWGLAADLAVWVLASLFMLVPGLQLWSLERALAPLRPEYRRIAQTKQVWEELRSLTDPTGSALEVLQQVSQPLLGEKPKHPIKLTTFFFGPAELTVKGVTSSGEQVIADYLSYLSKNPQLQGLYLWPAKAPGKGEGSGSGFTITAPSTAPQPEKKEGPNSR